MSNTLNAAGIILSFSVSIIMSLEAGLGYKVTRKSFSLSSIPAQARTANVIVSEFTLPVGLQSTLHHTVCKPGPRNVIGHSVQLIQESTEKPSTIPMTV